MISFHRPGRELCFRQPLKDSKRSSCLNDPANNVKYHVWKTRYQLTAFGTSMSRGYFLNMSEMVGLLLLSSPVFSAGDSQQLQQLICIGCRGTPFTQWAIWCRHSLFILIFHFNIISATLRISVNDKNTEKHKQLMQGGYKVRGKNSPSIPGFSRAKNVCHSCIPNIIIQQNIFHNFVTVFGVSLPVFPELSRNSLSFHWDFQVKKLPKYSRFSRFVATLLWQHWPIYCLNRTVGFR